MILLKKINIFNDIVSDWLLAGCWLAAD